MDDMATHTAGLHRATANQTIREQKTDEVSYNIVDDSTTYEGLDGAKVALFKTEWASLAKRTSA